MGTIRVYGYDNAEEGDEPTIVIELNEDNTEIISAVPADSAHQESIDDTLREYMEFGLTAIEAVRRIAGTYGVIRGEGVVDGEIEEAVVSAPEGDTATPATPDLSEIPTGADRVFSGDTMALVDEEGIVASLFRATEDGTATVRVNNKWKPLGDLSVIEGTTFVGVSPDSVSLYDRHQSAGNLVPIKFYTPSPGGPYWTELVESDADETPVDETADEEPLAASIVLNTAEDLDAAIAAALVSTDLRWFVERRVQALGIEASLPWLEN